MNSIEKTIRFIRIILHLFYRRKTNKYVAFIAVYFKVSGTNEIKCYSRLLSIWEKMRISCLVKKMNNLLSRTDCLLNSDKINQTDDISCQYLWILL